MWADLDDLPINPVKESRKLEIKQLSIQDEIETSDFQDRQGSKGHHQRKEN